jgi:hypothetical protein
MDVIWVDLDGDRAVDGYPADTGYLAKIKATYPESPPVLQRGSLGHLDLCLTADDTANNRRLTSAKGALFNAQLLGEALASHPDGRTEYTTRSCTGHCWRRRLQTWS